MRRLRSDGGFTLIELMLSMSLLGLISLPLTGAIFVVLRNTSYTLDRAPTPTNPSPGKGTVQDQLVTSKDQSLLDSAFGADVQSSAVVTATKPACAVPPTSVVVTSIVGLSWPDSAGGAVTTTRSAWYYLARPMKPDGSADLTKLAELRRASCSAAVSTPSTPTAGSARDVALSRSVGAAAPTARCDGAALPCPTTGKLVVMQVALGLDAPVTFALQGQRRLG